MTYQISTSTPFLLEIILLLLLLLLCYCTMFSTLNIILYTPFKIHFIILHGLGRKRKKMFWLWYAYGLSIKKSLSMWCMLPKFYCIKSRWEDNLWLFYNKAKNIFLARLMIICALEAPVNFLETQRIFLGLDKINRNII
jgi:hypothetical protein